VTGYARGLSAGHLTRRDELLVVARNPKSSERPIDEEDAAEDGRSWYWPERSAVLRDAAVVAEDVVLLRPEMGREEGISGDVVGLLPVDEGTSVATDDGVAGDADGVGTISGASVRECP
jgi:hypothetical protein